MDEMLGHFNGSKRIGLLLLLLLDLPLASCAQKAVAAGQSVGIPKDCPAPASGTMLLVDEVHGYCLLHPDIYQVEKKNDRQTALFVESMPGVDQAKLLIEVRSGNGRTVQQAVEELISRYPDFNLQPHYGLTMGGEHVVAVIDKVPGRYLSRQIVMVHDDLLYKLTFIPADGSVGEMYKQMERLFRGVVASFTFLDP
jgi:hypothetical protein